MKIVSIFGKRIGEKVLGIAIDRLTPTPLEEPGAAPISQIISKLKAGYKVPLAGAKLLHDLKKSKLK